MLPIPPGCVLNLVEWGSLSPTVRGRISRRSETTQRYDECVVYGQHSYADWSKPDFGVQTRRCEYCGTVDQRR